MFFPPKNVKLIKFPLNNWNIIIASLLRHDGKRAINTSQEHKQTLILRRKPYAAKKKITSLPNEWRNISLHVPNPNFQYLSINAIVILGLLKDLIGSLHIFTSN